jgi:hypothetical protein
MLLYTIPGRILSLFSRPQYRSGLMACRTAAGGKAQQNNPDGHD